MATVRVPVETGADLQDSQHMMSALPHLDEDPSQPVSQDRQSSNAEAGGRYASYKVHASQDAGTDHAAGGMSTDTDGDMSDYSEEVERRQQQRPFRVEVVYSDEEEDEDEGEEGKDDHSGDGGPGPCPRSPSANSARGRRWTCRAR